MNAIKTFAHKKGAEGFKCLKQFFFEICMHMVFFNWSNISVGRDCVSRPLMLPPKMCKTLFNCQNV